MVQFLQDSCAVFGNFCTAGVGLSNFSSPGAQIMGPGTQQFWWALCEKSVSILPPGDTTISAVMKAYHSIGYKNKWSSHIF